MKIFIGCSAQDVAVEKYGSIVQNFLEKICALDDVSLVFGAYRKGLMGMCYDTFKKAGKEITGVAPKIYQKDLEEIICDEQIIVENTQERLAKIYQVSDVFLFLPGGVGTYSELFSCLEERKSNPKDCLIVLYNIDFFFRPMLEEMYKLYQEGFLEENLGDVILISNSQEEIIEKIKERRK